MYRLRLWRNFVVIILASLIMVMGCTEQDPMASALPEEDVITNNVMLEPRGRYATLYYIAQQGGYLVPINQELCETERPVRVVLERLIAGMASGEGLIAPIPPETKVRDLYIREGTAYVDLSADFIANLRPGNGWARWAVDTLVQTLTEFPDVERVQFLIDGMVKEELAEGVAVGIPLERQKWLNPVSEEPGEAMVVLYFDYQDKYLVPISKSMGDFSQSLSQQAVEELIEGPGGLVGLRPVVPANVRLRAYRVEEGTAYVDLDLGEENEDWDEGKALRAMLYSLMEFPHIQNVQLLVEGQVVGNVREQVELNNVRLQLPAVNIMAN